MEFLKDAFGEKALSFDEFSQAVAEKGFKIADLATGQYVGKGKYDDDLAKYKGFETKYNELQKSIEGDDGINAKMKAIEVERDDYKGKFSTAFNELSQLKSTQQAIKSGIKPEFAEFVANEAMKATSDTIDFDTALKTYTAKNPQFSAETTVVKKKTSLDLTGGETKNKDSNAVMNDIIRGSK